MLLLLALVAKEIQNSFFIYFGPSFNFKLPFCIRLPNSPGTCTLTGVAELWIVSTLEVVVLELAFGLCRGAIEVSVGPTVSVILAFIWLFLAAASLAVMGSGRVEGTGEFLGKINLNKLKTRNPERKKSLHIEEEYLG